jgi:ABC-type cobalt transport system substrate-binding protein
LAAQVLNNNSEADIKVYVSPDDPERAKRLFDDLMITNLEAHSKLKQVPFYTSTLLDRLSVIYRELLEEFISLKVPESHTEENFVHFLSVTKQYSKGAAKNMLRGAIKTAALAGSALEQYVAEASKDASFPITIDLLEKTIFPATLYLEPATAKFTSDQDYRNSETQNFAEIAQLLVSETQVTNWKQNIKGKVLTHEQLKARRIWHKGAVLTWAPYIKSILYFALQAMTSEERERLLYREAMTEHQKEIIQKCLHRLFSHPIWNEPEGEVDSLLVSAKKQDDLFAKKGLTEKYVIYGEA